MGNCLPCQRRGGRRRRGRRGRNNRVDPGQHVTDTEQIHVVLSNGAENSRRPISREEAEMAKRLKNTSEEIATVPESVAFVVGLDNCVKKYNPQLAAVIQTINASLEENKDMTENEYSVEEEAMMEEILDQDQMNMARQKMAAKQKQAELRRQELLQKRKKAKPNNVTYMANDTKEQELDHVEMSQEAALRQAKKRRRPKPNPVRHQDGNSGKTVTSEVQSVEGPFTVEESRIMRDIVVQAEAELQKKELQNKMNEASQRREKHLTKKSKKAKHLATRESVDDEAVPSTSEVQPEVVQPEATDAYTKEDELLMQEIVDKDDMKEKKEAHDKKMAEAEARRERLLRKRSKKAKHLASREAPVEVVPPASDNTDVKPEEVQPGPSNAFTKEEEDLMNEIADEEDMKAKKEALQFKMFEAEARREKVLRKRTNKAKKMAKGGHMSSPEPGTSGADSDKAYDKLTEVLNEIRRKESETKKALAVENKFSTEEEIFMQSIMDEYDDDGEGKGQGHGRIGQG